VVGLEDLEPSLTTGVESIQPRTAVNLLDWPALGYLALCVVAWLAADRMRRWQARPGD